jgi:hypothetical protein
VDQLRSIQYAIDVGFQSHDVNAIIQYVIDVVFQSHGVNASNASFVKKIILLFLNVHLKILKMLDTRGITPLHSIQRH